ncbi:MAG TPA: glycosyltransferase family 2 protein [Chitinophagaceae bacterium]|nr:glycosyltransferase family 2 protein [Chitinophagaceae bacterium]
MDSPSVAIVILNWNGKKHLEQFLPSILSTTYSNIQVVVADNGSTDDSISFIYSNYPSIKVLRSSVNEGFAKGYNTALKQVDADYYMLLNSDVEVTPGWLEPMVSLLESNRHIGACQPKLLDYRTRSTFEYAGGAGGWLDAFGYPFCKGRIFDDCEVDKGQYDIAEPIFWASGAALFIRPELFHNAGGFDPFFFAHQEEIDLCWRIQLLGYKIYSCPASVVYHVGGGTLPKGNERKVFLNFRNNLIMLSKNLPWSQKVWKIPIRILLDAVSAWKNLLLLREPHYFWAVLKAHGAWISWILYHRKESIFPPETGGMLEGFYHGNIAWEHFIQGKKLFTEIVHSKK